MEFPLHEAAKAKEDNTETVRAFLAFIATGVDINTKDDYGDTPLHEAAWSGETETARALISIGADLNAKDYSGRTPVGVAKSREFNETAKALRLAGAKGHK